MKIVIDEDLCIGSGNCTHIAPKVFTLNELRIATVMDPNGADDATLLEAAENCPVEAIKLFKDDGTPVFPPHANT